MCGEWMVYGDDGDNNGEILIVLLLFEGIDNFLALLKLSEGEWDALYFLFLSSQVGILYP